MHARMTTIRTQPGKMEEALVIAREFIAPHAEEQPGFKSLVALVDHESEELVFISTWETEEDLEEGENSGYYEDQIGRLSSVLVGQAVREAFEVHNLA